MFGTDMIVVVIVSAAGGALLTACLLLAATPLFITHLRTVIRQEAQTAHAGLVAELGKHVSAARAEARISAGLTDGLARAAGEPPRPRGALRSIPTRRNSS